MSQAKRAQITVPAGQQDKNWRSNHGTHSTSSVSVRWYASGSEYCIAALEQCPAINFLCSPEHLAAWRAGHPDARGDDLALDEAFARGGAVFGNLLKTDALEVAYAQNTNDTQNGRGSRTD